jgi:hypothetical protein
LIKRNTDEIEYEDEHGVVKKNKEINFIPVSIRPLLP